MSKPNDPIVKIILAAYVRGKAILKEQEAARQVQTEKPKNDSSQEQKH